jgi:hypothetical protein
MLYAVMSVFKKSEIDDDECHYRTVRVYTNKVEAENCAKRHADKQKGIPEESVFGLIETTATAVPEVAMTPAT